MCKPKPIKRVLEVGVGGNKYDIRFRTTFTPNTVYRFCDKNPPKDCKCVEYCDVEDRLPYPNNFFDEVIMSHVIEHLNNPLKGLRECWRVLKPNGLLHIYTPSFLSPNARADPDHKHIFNSLTLYKLMKEAGFTIRCPHGLSIKNKLTSYIYLLLINLQDELYLVGEKK